MKNLYYLSFFCLLLFSCQTEQKSLTDYVDPFIGTGGHGHTYPGAAMPFGMVQLSPDSRLDGWDGCGGYHYSDEYIYGFSHTHLSGTGVSDYGDVLLMPFTGDVHFNNGADSEAGYRSHFSHKKEEASPGYYSVLLEDDNINVELTVTKRVGFHQYNFPKKEQAKVILDLAHRDKVLQHSIEQVDEKTIKGIRYSEAWAENQRVHFYAEFSEPIQEIIYDKDSLKAAIIFNELKNPLLIKVGISHVDIDGAKKNLNAEIPHWDFEQTKLEAENEWTKELQKIEVKGKSEKDKTIFYTALYHAFLNPNIFNDVDGRYLGMDLKIHQLPEGENHYTVFSLWDTFRAAHPLFTIIQQERTNEFIRTFLRQYEQGGELPIWELSANYTGCMIGYHAVPVITDAYVKGLRDYDINLALKAMQHSANQNKLGLEFYKNNGFIASDEEAESVSKTLEYAYDDWCIAVMADSLNEKEIAHDFYQRGQFYKNIFHPESHFMQAKNNNTWARGFKPEEVNFNYTEANSWQYSLFAPQDIEGHMALMGGEKNYENYLDSLFVAASETSGREQVDITGLIGQYAHGNEPSHHMAFLYNYTGSPWKTQEKTKQILEEQYTTLPDGLSGNEDCGQMSAWYVLASMGMYSVTPGLDYYTLSSPIFSEVKINLENGNTFEINTHRKNTTFKYINGVSLNNNDYSKSYLKHDDIINGGEIYFTIGKSKNNWGVEKENRPPSKISQSEIIPIPFFKAESQTFTDSLVLGIGKILDGNIYYGILDNEQDLKKSILKNRLKEQGLEYPSLENDLIQLYTGPITLKKDTKIIAILEKNGKASKPITAEFFKIDGSREITLNSTYANQYAAAGDKALIDYLRGGKDYRTGRWQGYREDLNIVIDLGEIKPIQSISVGFLQDIRSWIFYPPSAEFYVSNDGKNFKKVSEFQNKFPDNEYGTFTSDYSSGELNTSARYIQIKAPNYGICPDWHLGKGGETWLFTDEIIIN
ncbi:MAG: putative alpha-1,2-mannosidase [Maribacter sp.]|jgi:predicted alpha-1,2-mannosidase